MDKWLDISLATIITICGVIVGASMLIVGIPVSLFINHFVAFRKQFYEKIFKIESNLVRHFCVLNLCCK